MRGFLSRVLLLSCITHVPQKHTHTHTRPHHHTYTTYIRAKHYISESIPVQSVSCTICRSNHFSPSLKKSSFAIWIVRFCPCETIQGSCIHQEDVIVALTDVGNTPYVLLKNVLKRATPKQLYRIEQANPVSFPSLPSFTTPEQRFPYLFSSIAPHARIRWYTEIYMLRVPKFKNANIFRVKELWLTHCLTFQEFREGYQKGLHRDPAAWRSFYWVRVVDREIKRHRRLNFF